MKKLFGLLLIYLMFSSAVFAKDLRFIQITDVRYSKANNSETLKQVIKNVNKQKDVDFVVFTGDNIQKPDKHELYNFLAAANKLNRPFYVLIGDKDVNKHKDLSKKDYQKILKKKVRSCKTNDLNYVFEKGGVVFIVVDGAKDVIPGTNGYYKDDVVDWVDRTLDSHSKKNVVILQHFPLIPPTENESYVTFKRQKYLDVIQKHPNVRAVVAGHFGVNKEEVVDEVKHISTAPAPSYRIIDIIDCTSKNPSIWAEVVEVK
jgi:3',5'-cyclic AMP phosphodiesterase CpdA